LAWLIWGRIEHYRLASSVEALQREFTEAEKGKKSAKEIHDKTADITKWDNEKVYWLAWIYDLEQAFPPPQDAVLEQLTANSTQVTTASPQPGQIGLKGRTSGLSAIVRLEDGISTHGGKLSDKGRHPDTSVPPYTYSFEGLVLPEKSAKSEKGAKP
jgi:hypothetical protein